MRKKNYPSIGVCIYCLKKFEPNELTDEHIVPAALKGTLVFKKAVCHKCKEETGVQERLVLKQELLIPRVVLELRPITSKFRVHHGQMSPEDFPRLLTSVIINQPGLLIKENLTGIKSIRAQFINLYNANTSVDIEIRQELTSGAIQHMIGKIAYSYAIAEKGLNFFDSTEIRKVLLNQSQELFNYVGSAAIGDNGKTAHLHWLSFFEKDEYLCCRVHLFGSIGMHPHYVVLGKKLTI